MFPRGEREREESISVNFATETATATAKNNQRWPGITSVPSARRLSLVLNMSPDICDPIPAIAHTSVSIVETSSPEAISSRDTSINAIPTRNLSSHPLLLAARAHLLPVGPPPRSKPVTNVSSPLCLVMEPILVPNVCIGRRDAPMSNSIARLRLSDRVIQPVPPSILQTPRTHTHLSAPSL